MKQSLVQWINGRLCNLVPGSQIFGIAKQARRGNEILPVNIHEGKETYIGIDGKIPLQLYHKEISTTTNQETIGAYGDDVYIEVNTYQMAMIIFFDQKRLRLDADQLYIEIQRKISGGLKLTGARSARISVTSLIMDDAKIYAQEYNSDSFRLTVDQRLIQVNYNMRVAFNKNCIPKCI